jgi:small GTP-binding protein
MGLMQAFQGTALGKVLLRAFGRKHARIGLYGPPNAGKTTLANRIARDFTGETVGVASPVPHETRRVRKKADIDLKSNGGRIHIDVIDTPGIATQIDFHEFVEDHGMVEEEARRRAKEATEGVIEAIRWLDDVDGVLLVMDSAEDPFTQVNVTILGNLEARRLPVIIVANKIDLPEASPATLKAAFPQHPVVPVSAGEGTNMDALYEAIAKHFR